MKTVRPKPTRRVPRNPILMDIFARVGSATKLAQELGITRQAISFWQQVPLSHVKAVAKITGMTREQIRPDIYG